MREEDTEAGSGQVGGQEVSVVTPGRAGHTLHLALHLAGDVGHQVDQVLVHPPVELVGAGLVAVPGLTEAAPAGVDLLTAEEQGADLTEGKTLAGEVGDELAVWRLIAELATLLQTGHPSNTFQQSPLVNLTGGVLTGTFHRGTQGYCGC